MGRPTMTIRGRWLTIALGVCVVAAACADLPSDPATPFSIEIVRAPSPSVVAGDTMRDSLGAAAPVRAIAYNAKGERIEGAPIRYYLAAAKPDSAPVTIDPVTGIMVATSDTAFIAHTYRVYAEVGGVQSQPETLTVTRRPDTLQVVKARDSLQLSFLSAADSLPVSRELSVALKSLRAADAAWLAVPAYRVRFRIVYPASAASDTSYAMLTNGDRRRSETDTTDGSGAASRSVRIRKSLFPFATAKANTVDTTDKLVRDSIVIEATAIRERGGAVPGSGQQLVLIVRAPPVAKPVARPATAGRVRKR